MKTILFTDLDDTLFATTRKQRPDASYTLATTLRDGSPSAYLSPKQQRFQQLWQKNALCIPVTARNRDAFERVHLTFSDVAIINHGGTILRPDGTLDAVWHKQQQHHAKDSANWLQTQYECLRRLAEQQQADVRLRINHDCGLDLYVLLKSAHGDDAAVARIATAYQQQYADANYGYVHCNGNNLAILPNWLGKARAVVYLKEQMSMRYGEILCIGFGDSHSDLPFMQQCDYWMTPSGSQITQAFTDVLGESAITLKA